MVGARNWISRLMRLKRNLDGAVSLGLQADRARQAC